MTSITSSLQVNYFGQEQNPVVIFDNFYPDPEKLLQLASTAPGFAAQTSDYYPGVRKQIDGGYSQWVLDKVEQVIQQFFLPPAMTNAHISLCAFSLATTPVHKLRPIQCVPHVDTQDANQFALVHYLCPEHYGGTAFFRHQATGYESITQERTAHYFPLLKQQVIQAGMSLGGYIRGDTDIFTKTGQVDVRFNRAILYRSNMLHSGLIQEALGLDNNPRTGRLTANCFIHLGKSGESGDC
jgi:hypothetical protein